MNKRIFVLHVALLSLCLLANAQNKDIKDVSPELQAIQKKISQTIASGVPSGFLRNKLIGCDSLWDAYSVRESKIIKNKANDWEQLLSQLASTSTSRHEMLNWKTLYTNLRYDDEMRRRLYLGIIAIDYHQYKVDSTSTKPFLEVQIEAATVLESKTLWASTLLSGARSSDATEIWLDTAFISTNLKLSGVNIWLPNGSLYFWEIGNSIPISVLEGAEKVLLQLVLEDDTDFGNCKGELKAGFVTRSKSGVICDDAGTPYNDPGQYNPNVVIQYPDVERYNSLQRPEYNKIFTAKIP